MPKGTTLAATGHTHGAWKEAGVHDGRDWNDLFSPLDNFVADKNEIIIYLATPSGSLLEFDPALREKKGALFGGRTVMDDWRLPHDWNHPDRSRSGKSAKDHAPERCDNCIS